MLYPSLHPVETRTSLSTLIDLLRHRGLNEPTLEAYRFLADAEDATSSITYGELDLRARAIAAFLQSKGLEQERALLLYPAGLDFIAAFFGCLYAGTIAVPASLPQTKRGLARLRTIAEDAQAACVLTTGEFLSKIEREVWANRVVCVASEAIDSAEAAGWREPMIDGHSLAYLQYTSGSTSTPKGVMVTHANVLENSAYIQHGFEHGPESVSLSWLPHFHDMGLVDGIIQPLYSGFLGLLMSPATLLQNPARWLQAITRYRVTHSGGPNFAYDLCVRRVDEAQRALLDLSSWQVAYNGAEPVRHETLERFASAFSPCGFRRQAFYPAYGLAEATLKVTGRRRGEGPVYRTLRKSALAEHRVVPGDFGEAESRTLVGCGRAALGTEVMIVNPESSLRCGPEEVGEIWVSGPGVAAGYWNRSEETERVFQARVAQSAGSDFLRTGDLGFVAEGELFITGRLKDLIIIRGRNHYPQDVELAMQSCHAALKPDGGAAFSVEAANEEQLVVVHEIESRGATEAAEIIAAIRAVIAEEFELQPAAVVLIRSGTLPRTSSGKVQRGACREAFLNGTLREIAAWHAPKPGDRQPLAAPEVLNAESVAQWLCLLLTERLGIEPPLVERDRPLTGYGIDSLSALEMTHAVETGLGVKLPLTALLESPTVAELTARILAQLASAEHSLRHSPVAGVVHAGEHPLSHGQQALWAVQHVAPESTAYNVSFAARLGGEVDVDALRRAFETLVQRHALLRAHFPARNGVAVCVVPERAEISLHVEDAEGWTEEALHDRLNEEAWTSFDLERGPLLRGYLFRRSAGEHYLLLCAHHIVVDLWSLGILLRELSLALATVRPYSDYVRQQAELLGSPEGERLRDYWLQQLAGELPVLDLPADRARPLVQTYRGASVSTKLDQHLTARLQQLAASHDATLFMTLLAAFHVLLYRYTGQEETLIGSPSSGRSSAEFAGTIGYFVNPLVLRAKLSGDRSFSEFLAETRRTALAAFEHQDYPFPLLVKQLQPQRDPARSPLFQVMFAFQKSDVTFSSGWQLEAIVLDQRAAQFDLSLTVTEVGNTLEASFEYNTDLFESITIERLGEHFRNLLEGIVADPSVTLSNLALQAATERRQVLFEWNDTHADFGPFAAVHELFEHQAARTPDQAAVVYGAETLSYRELNERANRLARYLRARDVGAEARIGISVPRSTAMFVCVLGVLKAGGAYVPLDPSYPEERLAFMLRDSGSALLLTEEFLEAERAAIDAHSVENLSLAHTAENLAYIIYTSGSTGTPKGVMVQHGSLANYIRAASIAYEIGPEDRVLQFSSFSFDASVEEIFVCLTSGATLVLRDGEAPKAPAEFIEECRAKKLTVVDLPTAYWHELVSHLRRDDWTAANDLRLVIIGGDKALPETVERWRSEVGPRIRLINTYGPTEATIVATMSDLGVEQAVSIGRPVANTQAYVLDQQLQPAVVGARGQLYLGGADVSRGYLGDPRLTAERFVPDPFSRTPGARLYRTGDLARWRHDGQIEFLGRMDQQVKIRGHRIEPAEIEAMLLRHEAVRDAVVIARDEGNGERRLAAYVVGAVMPQELRRFLADRLPPHLVPASFTLLAELPRLPSGKIDRRALPLPKVDLTPADGAYVAPVSWIEKVVCDLWAEVLKVERVGIHDDFFALGGDSILSIQVAARARVAGLQISSSQIFQHPTPGELAKVATSLRATHAEAEPITGDVPLTPIQHWFFEQQFSAPDHWNMSVMLEPRERLDADLLDQALTHLVQHHDALRFRFVNEPEGWRQSSPEPRINKKILALETIADEIQAQLDLSRGDLLRAVLYEADAEQPQRLFIAIHHLVVDGVSWRILLEDLGRVYRQLQRVESVSFPVKTTSFVRWARLLVEHAHSEQVRGELSYWSELSRKHIKPLPVDSHDGQNLEAETQTFTIALDADETRVLLRDVVRAYDARINEVLLAALVDAVADWTSKQSILIELEGHGREELFADVDLSRTVGWFTNAFPVLLERKAEHSPAAALESVKQQLRSVPGQGIGYGLLRYLNDESAPQLRDLPVPEISFNYLGQLDQMLDEPALFSLVSGTRRGNRHSSARRSQLLEINAHVSNQRLQVDWNYSSGFHRQQTIENLSQRFVQTLRTLISKLQTGETDEDLYPLSPLQQGMLFHSAYAPGSTIYIGQLSFALQGKLDVSAFTEAWRRAVARHEILRTSFVWEDREEPLQRVSRDVAAPLEFFDWSEFSQADQETRIDALLEADRRRGFDPAVAPLLRLKLLQLGDESYRFVWTHHHLLLDGWSIALLLEEIFADYEALRRGVDRQLSRARQYRDYIAWLRRQDTARANSFWRAYLEGFQALTPLAVDHAPADPSREADIRRVRVALSESDRLRVFARRRQLTLSTMVQGAWALLLSRYSRETDVVYGATVAGRPASFAGIESMIGLFINTLPVRVRLQPETPVVTWLKAIQAEQVLSREYEHSPLVELQALSAVPRGVPLFETLLVFENYPLDVRGFAQSVNVDDIWWFDQTNYPLTLVVTPEPELSLEIFYDAHRFTAEVVQRMLGHLQHVLDRFAADPAQSISQVSLVTDSERAVLLSEWNDTRKAGSSRCVHQLFEEQARRTPNQVALASGTEQVTYAELNARANRLARYLMSNGVEAESRVCICLEPGPEMIVAVLGVLKAGAAYVPLDPAYPKSRLAYMLNDCRARVLLTESRLPGGRVSTAGNVRTISLDEEQDAIRSQSPDDPAVEIFADNLIYVIYTSGSTGRPKGAGVTHGGFANLVNWFVSEFGLNGRERALIISSFSFDLTQKDIFAPLTVGGQLHFPSSALYEPAEIVATISEAAITFVNCTPSAFYPLVETVGPRFEKLASLKHVFLGGEPINVSRLREWSNQSAVEIVNTYGPTEATDTCSSFCLTDFEHATSAPPIGRPNDNAELLILDRHLNLVPQGVAGELCVGGAGVGRGYLNDPAATAQRFVPHPFSAEPGARLYRTGDLARHLPDGNIEFLGRLDHQVKVAGYRIELGEIEALMAQHPAVKECVVVVRPDVQGNARLVAYLVAKYEGQYAPDASVWRRYLADSLPLYMIPSAFVTLEKLPFTLSGKVARRALPAPETMSEAMAPDYVAPRTPVEEVLAGIWREVLAVERVGIHDNFLNLGGHSLLAMRCVSGIRRVFRVELPLRVLFESANLAELAQALSAYEERPGALEKIARVMQRVKGVSREELQAELLKRRASKAGVKEDA